MDDQSYYQIRAEPILIGRDLHDYYSIEALRVRAIYLVLVVGTPTGHIRFELFWESLRQHKFHNDTIEVDFDSGIALNMANFSWANTVRISALRPVTWSTASASPPRTTSM